MQALWDSFEFIGIAGFEGVSWSAWYCVSVQLCVLICKLRLNVKNGKVERKHLTTGMHTVCDIFCVVCSIREPVGWKYVRFGQPR